MTVVSNIPQYYSYKTIYADFLMARRIHSCLVNRFSNDTMFVGKTQRLEELYHQMTKLYVIIETMSELFNDNPIYDCNLLITDEEYLPKVIDMELESKYIGYFNKLYSCLKTTMDSIKTCKKGLSAQFIIEGCEREYSSGNQNSSGGCLQGDYNDDYSDDYYKEICNVDTGGEQEGLKVYVGISENPILTEADIITLSDFNAEASTFVGTYHMSTGGYKYFAWPDSYGGAINFRDDGSANIAMWSGYSNSENGFTYELINISGVPYRLYRTSYVIGSTLIAEIS